MRGAPHGRLLSASRTASRLSQIIAASRSSDQYLLKHEVLVNAYSSKHGVFFAAVVDSTDGTYFSIPRNTHPRKQKSYGTTRENESSCPTTSFTAHIHRKPSATIPTSDSVCLFSLLKHHNLNHISLDHPRSQLTCVGLFCLETHLRRHCNITLFSPFFCVGSLSRNLQRERSKIIQHFLKTPYLSKADILHKRHDSL